MIDLAISFFPSYADCGDDTRNDLDKQCNDSQCQGNEDKKVIKGCYYVPPDGVLTDDKCKDKTNSAYPKVKGQICCCEK